MKMTLFLLIFTLSAFSYDNRSTYVEFSGGVITGSDFGMKNDNNFSLPIGANLSFGFGQEIFSNSFISFFLGGDINYWEINKREIKKDDVSPFDSATIDSFQSTQKHWDLIALAGINLNLKLKYYLLGIFGSFGSGMSLRKDYLNITFSDDTNSSNRVSEAKFTPIKATVGVRLINSEYFYAFIKGSLIKLKQTSQDSKVTLDGASKATQHTDEYYSGTQEPSYMQIQIGGGLYF